MGQRWQVNTASGPRVIDGKLLQPGEGTLVDDGPLRSTAWPVLTQEEFDALAAAGDLTIGDIYNVGGSLRQALSVRDSIAVGGGGSGTVVCSAATFDALVAAGGLLSGTSYYIDSPPAYWLATGPSSTNGLGFVKGTTTYFGDQVVTATTEEDMPAGTFESRPLFGLAAGKRFYRRMTNVGQRPGGSLMTFDGGLSTEWCVEMPTWVALSMSLVTGAVQTALQVVNPRDLPAGILRACSFFDIRVAPSKSGLPDILTPTPYLGPNGTTADTPLKQLGTVTASGLNKGFEQSYKVVDAATIALLGANVGNGSWGGNEGSAAVLPTYAVDVTAALKVSLGISMSAANSTPGCAFIGLRLNP